MPPIPALSFRAFVVDMVGLRPGPGVVVSKMERDAGLYLVQSRCHAADRLEIVMLNATNADIDPPDKRFYVTQVAPGADGQTGVVS